MTDTASALEAARDAYRRREWVEARQRFAEAREHVALAADDLYALGNCSWWLGDLDAALPVQQEAYQRHLDAGQPGPAALVAVDVGYTLTLRGDEAPASGWIARATRLLEDLPDSAEHGYLVHLGFEDAFGSGQLTEAMEAAQRVHALGRRFDDPTLCALGVLGQGRVLVRQGEVGQGMALLDEAMVAAVSDDLDPGWAGNIYCHLMVACYEIADLRRAGEWTDATARWCESMPGAGPFLGICRVHRAQILQVRGDWDVAEREATHLCERPGPFHATIVGEAHYLLGELRRQRGDLAGAEEAYRHGHRLGRDPQPGLALVRLAQGETDAAAASIHAAIAAADGELLSRAHLLPTGVEVAIAAGDLNQARAWSAALGDAAETFGTTGLQAAAGHAEGSVLLASGDAAAALSKLREAAHRYRELDAPYEVARVRRALAAAYAELGDHDAATLERDAAATALARLGVVEADRAHRRRVSHPGGLTAREGEVLALVAAGRSNQEIAADLVLSVRTIERHLATIYQKLGLHGRSARAGAVSFAHREGIVAVER